MDELKLLVPTYYGAMYAKAESCQDKNDSDPPFVPVLIREAEGVHVVLGTHDFDDRSKPDIQIERRPNGWAIFLNPLPGGDTSGLIYLLDDGRSLLVPDGLHLGSIQVLDRVEEVPMIDDPPANERLPEPSVIIEPAVLSLDETAAPSIEVAASTEEGGGVAPLRKVKAALAQAESALAGDSNDAEHDALLALVEALDGFERPFP
jgi:hypothetical protein